MKKQLILFILVSLSIFSNRGYAGGIEFVDVSWQEALQAAKKANKLILIWAYKPGCGPCKEMTTEVFPNESVGEYFNSNFINFQLNTQKEEGISVFVKFEGVKNPATPTFYFIDPNTETLLLKHVGTTDVEGFLDFGKAASDFPNKMAAYKAGKMTQEEKIDFWLLLEGCNPSISKDVTKYFSTLKDEDLLIDHNFTLMTHYAKNSNSREFQYFISHTKEFKETLNINLDWYYSIVFQEVYEQGVQQKDRAAVLKFAEYYKLCADSDSDYNSFIEQTKSNLDEDIK